MTAPPAERLRKAIPARLDRWLTCPRQYRLQHVDLPAPPRAPQTTPQRIGTAVHGTMSRLFDGTAPVTVDRALTLLLEAWPAEPLAWRDREQSAEWLAAAALWVRQYVSTLPPGLVVLGTERQVAAPARTVGLAIEGRVDRVDDRGGAPVVVDYKTGRRPPSDTDARSSMTLALYLIATWRTWRRRAVRAELHHLPSGVIAVAEHDEASLRRHLDRAADVMRDITVAADTLEGAADGEREDAAAELFPARPSALCPHCPFHRRCPEGQAYLPPRLPWEHLDHPETASAEAVTADV
jgi:RecB family exonuclease